MEKKNLESKKSLPYSLIFVKVSQHKEHRVLVKVQDSRLTLEMSTAYTQIFKFSQSPVADQIKCAFLGKVGSKPGLPSL